MAATYTPQSALDYAKVAVSNMPLDTILAVSGSTFWAQVAQDALSAIWTAAPWRWTIGTLAPIALSTGIQTFTIASLPADFLKLDKCLVSDAITVRPVKAVAATTPSALIQQLPDFVSFIPGSPNSIQFESLFGPSVPTDTWNFYAWYKKVTPSIAGSLTTPGVLVMDDDYYWIYREFVLYYAFKYAYDQRAGGASVKLDPQGNRVVEYNGQLAVARAGIEELRTIENLQFAFPEANPTPDKVR